MYTCVCYMLHMYVYIYIYIYVYFYIGNFIIQGIHSVVLTRWNCLRMSCEADHEEPCRDLLGWEGSVAVWGGSTSLPVSI